MFRRLQRFGLFLAQCLQARPHLGGGQGLGRQAAQGGKAIDHGPLQPHLRFQALGQGRAYGLEFVLQLGGGNHRPLAVEVGNMVGCQQRVLEQRACLFEGGVAAAPFGFTVAVRIQARLHQLGDTAVGIAHRRMDPLELRRTMNELGGGQAQFGELALENEFHRGGFVAIDLAQLFGLQSTLRRAFGGRLFHLRLLSGRLVAWLAVARPLE
jgi:hypothetical protein